MAKEEYEFGDSDLRSAWRLVEGGYSGTMEKILSYDPKTGNHTRLVKMPPGTKIPDVVTHDFCEEVYILDGALTDTQKEIAAARGYYASRLPGMKHGPYESPLGCLSFEFRYQDPDKKIDPGNSLLKDRLGAPR